MDVARMQAHELHDYDGVHTHTLDGVPVDVIQRGANGAGLREMAQELNTKASEVAALNIAYRQMRGHFGLCLDLLEHHDPELVAQLREMYRINHE